MNMKDINNLAIAVILENGNININELVSLIDGDLRTALILTGKITRPANIKKKVSLKVSDKYAQEEYVTAEFIRYDFIRDRVYYKYQYTEKRYYISEERIRNGYGNDYTYEKDDEYKVEYVKVFDRETYDTLKRWESYED